MELYGLGTDIVQVDRIEKIVGKWNDKFLTRIYCPEELSYCRSGRNRYQRLAGRFAAKEAVIKSLGERVPWKSIKVISLKSGQPAVKLISSAGLDELVNQQMMVSISHTSRYATATALRLEK